MRYLILSDIHSNIEALTAIEKNATSFDKLICLGDLTGYGASPNGVITHLLRLEPAGIVRGNHDKVCTGLDSGSNFNNNAYASAVWTKKKLSKKNFDFVKSLKEGPLKINGMITICHGSPMDEDYYILYEHEAFFSFQCFDTNFCFFGHTHVPGLFVMEQNPTSFYYVIPKGDFETKVAMDGSVRYLINPGSVGQPRDGDPRACYCIFDTESQILGFYKVEYQVQRASDKILKAGLPAFLAERLVAGV